MTALPAGATAAHLNEATDDVAAARYELYDLVLKFNTVRDYLIGLFGVDGNGGTALQSLGIQAYHDANTTNVSTLFTYNVSRANEIQEINTWRASFEPNIVSMIQTVDAARHTNAVDALNATNWLTSENNARYNEILNRPIRDQITTVGFQSGDVHYPYFRHAANNQVYTIVGSPDNTVSALTFGYVAPYHKLHALTPSFGWVVIFSADMSDERLKADIKPTAIGAAATLARLAFVQFDWGPESGAEGHIDLGLVAQDAREIDPDLVNESSTGFLSINASRLQYLTARALQETLEKVSALEARIARLEATRNV